MESAVVGVLGQIGRAAGNKSDSCRLEDLSRSAVYCFAAGIAPPSAISQARSVRAAAVRILDDGEGETFLNTLCTSCHTLERVRNTKAAADDWGEIVDRMKEKGITLTDEDTASLVDYLARKFR
jgi:hypothetical protein